MNTKLITADQHRQLLRNGRLQREAQAIDAHLNFYPIVKLFTPDGACTWLLTEIDPDDYDRAFGLCDLGMGYPELGSVSLRELAGVKGKLGLPIERDRHYAPSTTIDRLAAEAAKRGHIAE